MTGRFEYVLPQWKRNVYVIWLALFVAAICWTMVMPFIPVYLQQLGMTSGVEFWSGLIISVASFCSMVMSPVWGAVGDRYGRRMMMLRAGFFLMVGYVLLAFIQTPVQLMLVRAMVGALTGFVPMGVALVGVSTPQEEVGKALGLVQTAWPSGAIIGPVVGGVALDLFGLRISSIVSAVLIALATALVMLTVREQFSRPTEKPQGILNDIRVAAGNRLLMNVVLVTAVANATVMALEPVIVPFVQQIAGANAPSWLSGFLYALPGVAFVLMATWWAQRGEKTGYSQTVALGLILSAVLYVPQALVRGPWELGVLRLGSGMAGAAIGPGIAALLALEVPQDLRGRAFGINQAAANAGAIIGPLIGGWVGSYISARWVFVLAAVLYFFGWAWVKRAVEPKVTKTVVRVIPRSSVAGGR